MSQRPRSPTHWRNQPAAKTLTVRIPPVAGTISTPIGLLQSENLHPLEENTRAPAFKRPETSTHWRKTPAHRPPNVLKPPSTGGIGTLVCFPASGFSHPLEESARTYTPELSRFFQRVEGSGHELTYREHSSYRLDAKARRSASMAVNIGRTGPNLSSSDPETGALAAPSNAPGSNTTPAASTDAPNPSCEAFGII